MGKEDNFVLRGKLVRKPRTGFSYFRTRREFVRILREAKHGESTVFVRIGNLKIEEDKFDIPIKIDKAVLSGLNNDWDREEKLDAIGILLEQHFGIGTGIAEEGKEDKEKEAEGKRKVREMEGQGIIPVAYFTEFEEKDFEG